MGKSLTPFSVTYSQTKNQIQVQFQSPATLSLYYMILVACECKVGKTIQWDM
jgi:hypothetical protein